MAKGMLRFGAFVVALALLGSCGSSDTEEAVEEQAVDAATADVQAPTARPTSESAATDDPSQAPEAPTATPEPTQTATPEPTPTPETVDLSIYGWTEIADDAPWLGRAGLRLVELDGRLLLLGGRTPNQSTIPGDSRLWGDVWASNDGGSSWTEIHSGPDPDVDPPSAWKPRAYFQSVVKDDHVYVIGGQDFGLQENPFCALLEQGLAPPPGLGIDPDAPCPEFLPTSEFFNDVWRSADGVSWQQMTDDAPWTGRAGLSAEVFDGHLYVLGGSTNDDSSIIGPDGPQRIYYNDVWRSSDGTEWELVTDDAPWAPRAGAVTVVDDGVLLVLGGEDGFTCSPLPDCEPPYFNDVWASTDGSTWDLRTEAAGWSPRPGHACELIDSTIVCFGGFGLTGNPVDMWSSDDGAEWTRVATDPWNVPDPTDIKYDFASTVVGPPGDQRILTAGGDRETFDFADPDNYLRIDSDVWEFAPA